MDYMFYNCNSLKSIDLSNFNTSNVTNMKGMFYNCSSLTSIILSNFNSKNIKTKDGINQMFINCNKLQLRNIKCNDYTIKYQFLLDNKKDN